MAHARLVPSEDAGGLGGPEYRVLGDPELTLQLVWHADRLSPAAKCAIPFSPDPKIAVSEENG